MASQFSQNAISPSVLAMWLRICDFLSVTLIGLGIYLAYVVPNEGFRLTYLMTCVAGGLMSVVALQATDSYQVVSLRSKFQHLGRVVGAWTAIFAVFALVAFFAKLSENYSRVWFGSWYLAGILFFIIFRGFVSTMVRRWARDGRLERRAVIVGGGKNAEDLIVSLESQIDNNIRICGIFDDRGGDRSPPMVAGYPKLGTIAELVEFGRKARIDMLIVSLPISAESRVLALLKKV